MLVERERDAELAKLEYASLSLLAIHGVDKKAHASVMKMLATFRESLAAVVHQEVYNPIFLLSKKKQAAEEARRERAIIEKLGKLGADGK